MKTVNILILVTVLSAAQRVWAQVYPDVLVQEARRLNYPLVSLRGASLNYSVIKNPDGSPDYSVALQELRRDAEAYHRKKITEFLSMSPDAQSFQLKKLEGLSQMKGVPPEEHEQYMAEVRDLSTAKIVADVSSQSKEQTKFQMDKLQGLAQLRGISDEEREMYRQQYKALSVMHYLENEATMEEKRCAELKGSTGGLSCGPTALRGSRPDEQEQEVAALKNAALAEWQQSGGFNKPRSEKIMSVMKLLDSGSTTPP